MGTRLAFALWCALSALLLLAGGHRLLYAVTAPLPDLAASALAGLANLAWYELAYVIGSAVKRPEVFVAIPWVGIAAALLPPLALARPAWFERAVRVQLAIGAVLAGTALALLVWRGARGFGDPWRTAAVGAQLAAQAVWAATLLWRQGPAPAAPPCAEPER